MRRRHRKNWVAWSLVFFCLTSNAQNLVDTLKLHKNGHYKEAETALTSILKTHCLDNSSDAELMIDGYKIKPSLLYSYRADCWSELGNYKQSKSDYFKSYQLNADPEKLRYIAECMYEMGEYKDSITKYDEYLATENLDWEGEYLARYYRAFPVFKNGNPEQAICDLQKLKDEVPKMKDSIQKTINQFVSEKRRIDALKNESNQNTHSIGASGGSE